MISRADIQAFADDIAARFDVEKIILFGSYAYGTPTEDSDVDVLVLKSIHSRPLDDAVQIAVETNPQFPCDVIVRDPQDAVRRYEQWDPLIRRAFEQGVVLYERADTALAR